MVYYRLQQAIKQEPRGAYLHRDTDQVYAKQILTEEKQRDPKKGIEQWVQVGSENHLFDAEVICQALAEPEWPGGGVNLLRRRVAMRPHDEGTATNKRTLHPYKFKVARSRFMSR